MQYTNENQTGDAGEHLVAYQFIRHFQWACRLQDKPDTGIDAEYELVDANFEALGKIAKIQVKATAAAFKPGNNDFYVDQRHLDYWQNFSVPVIFCYVSLASQQILWMCVEPDDPYRTRGAGHKFMLDSNVNLLTAHSRKALEDIADRPTAPWHLTLQIAEHATAHLLPISGLDGTNPEHLRYRELLKNSLEEVELQLKQLPPAQHGPNIAARVAKLNRFFDSVCRAFDAQNRGY